MIPHSRNQSTGISYKPVTSKTGGGVPQQYFSTSIIDYLNSTSTVKKGVDRGNTLNSTLKEQPYANFFSKRINLLSNTNKIDSSVTRVTEHLKLFVGHTGDNKED